jgi:hypothetical protein
MNCAFIVQTCDKYEFAWEGFFYYMKKQWDFNIDIPMYFCNEEKTVDLPKPFVQIKTGKGTFVENLNNILGKIQEENIFYMLEDFWPFAPMKKELFNSAYGLFTKNNFDSLQIGNYTPWYELEKTEYDLLGQNLLKFSENGDWLFNFQSRFWKKSIFKSCLIEPEISEKEVSSAITVEMASDEYARNNLKLQCYLYHYFWYPLSGTVYRGEFNDFGKQLVNVVNIDKFVQEKFNLQLS